MKATAGAALRLPLLWLSVKFPERRQHHVNRGDSQQPILRTAGGVAKLAWLPE